MGSAVARILHTDKSLKRFSDLSGRFDQSQPYANEGRTNEEINKARDLIGANKSLTETHPRHERHV